MIKFFDFFCIYINEYKYSTSLLSKKAKEDYENNKDRLSKQARDRYNSLPEEKKDKKREYRRNQHYNMT